MIIKLIKLIALNKVILLIFQLSFADNLLIPKKKPSISDETLKKKISKNLILPKKKPNPNLQTDKQEIKKKDDVKITKINGVIIPKTGGNTEFLLNNGYKIEALSPDDFQKDVIIKKFQDRVPFHHCKFENYHQKKEFDLILESESACYIKIDEGFAKAR